MGIMLGIQIAISYIPSIKIGNFTEFGFGFIGTALSGALFGPLYGLILATLSDIITSVLHGKAFFIGFTISAALAGLIYGIGFWKKERNFRTIFMTVLLVTVIVNLGLNSIWVKIITDKAWATFMTLRFSKNIISLFINTAVLTIIFNNPTVNHLLHRYQL